MNACSLSGSSNSILRRSRRRKMRDYGKVPSEFWLDQNGNKWKVPTIKGRLKMRVPCHRALREFVLWRDGFKCRHCGSQDRIKLVADHIVSRRNGGAHHPDNMQCLCDSCNARKASLVDAKFQSKSDVSGVICADGGLIDGTH
ncbi:HNH endonuclease signature motif containing protein [Enterobacter roggenkampii]|uniref:HNH endonuclease n=3 Tax=Enterobacterales TaxID=91347 RepID=UPI000A0EE02B